MDLFNQLDETEIYDENGRLIQNTNKSAIVEETEEYDENGRLIVKSTEEDNSVEETEEYDENGRLIVKSTEEDNSVEEVDCNIEIYMAELDSKCNGNLKYVYEWVMNKENTAAFFIYSAEENLSGKWFNLVDTDSEEIIWESTITEIPGNYIKVGKEGRMAQYMTKKGISFNNIEKGDRLYFASIEDVISEVFTFNVIDATEKKISLEDGKTYFEGQVGVSTEEQLGETTVNVEGGLSKVEVEVNDSNDKSVNTEVEDVVTETKEENDVKKVNYQRVVGLDINEEELNERIRRAEEISRDQSTLPSDIMTRLFIEFFKDNGVKIVTSDFEKVDSKIDAEVIIEKTGDTYKAIYTGLGETINLVNDESPLFNFKYGSELFVEKAMNILKSMLAYNQEKVDSLKKVLIADSEDIIDIEGVTVLDKKDIIKSVANNGTNVIYYSKDSVYCSIVNQKNRRFELTFNRNEVGEAFDDLKKKLDLSVDDECVESIFPYFSLTKFDFTNKDSMLIDELTDLV